MPCDDALFYYLFVEVVDNPFFRADKWNEEESLFLNAERVGVFVCVVGVFCERDSFDKLKFCGMDDMESILVIKCDEVSTTSYNFV